MSHDDRSSAKALSDKRVCIEWPTQAKRLRVREVARALGRLRWGKVGCPACNPKIGLSAQLRRLLGLGVTVEVRSENGLELWRCRCGAGGDAGDLVSFALHGRPSGSLVEYPPSRLPTDGSLPMDAYGQDPLPGGPERYNEVAKWLTAQRLLPSPTLFMARQIVPHFGLVWKMVELERDAG